MFGIAEGRRAPGAGRRAPGGAWRLWSLALVLLVVAGCGSDGPGGERESDGRAVSAVDESGRTVTLERPAVRVLSLIPSVTETVVAVAGAERLVGRTDFDEAEEVMALPSVGGGLDPSLETILSLRPDVVFAWEEKQAPELRQRLERMGIPVFTVATRDTADIFAGIARIGQLTGESAAADSVAAAIRAELEAVRRAAAERPRLSGTYLLWPDPPMIAGPATFISQLLEVAGIDPAFGDVEHDWPRLSMEAMVRRQPMLLVLPVGQDRHGKVDLAGRTGWREVRAVRDGRVVEVPVDLISRPGPRIGEAARAVLEAVRAVEETP